MTNPADIPPPLPWDQRKKGVYPISGGYKGQIQILRRICDHVASERPSHSDLAGWMLRHFGLKSRGNTNNRLSFLQKAGVLEQTASQVHLSEWAIRWHVADDNGILIGLLHSRLRYIGEMLSELSDGPRSIEELRQAARNYHLDWSSKGEVNRRRGWLESAGLVEPTGKGRLAITKSGSELLSILTVHQPGSGLKHPEQQPSPAATPPLPEPSSAPDDADVPDSQPTGDETSPGAILAAEIREAATDSKNPDRLEFAVRDAFQFLGFDAEKLGGPGKTDVLIKAPLGKDASYSATIDAKTVGAGSLSDHQVDWVTLDEHRKQHNADHSMLIGPNPSGQRLINRAIDQTVAVLSTNQLADLCSQHADAPLSLQVYRALFETGGAVDTAPMVKATQDMARLRDIAAELCAKLAERTGTFGPLTASQLMVILDQPDKPSSAQEIQQVLDTLASPLVGAIQGTASEGYVLATALRVTQQRLHQLGDRLASVASDQDQ